MRTRLWIRWLFLAAPAGGVAIMAVMIAEKVRWPHSPRFWGDPAMEFGLLLIPALFYTVLALALLALNMDLSAPARAKGDLVRLLNLKRYGGFPDRSRRAGCSRPRRWGVQIGERPVVAIASDAESPLDRLVSLKRRGA
jgi:hypothetical protein